MCSIILALCVTRCKDTVLAASYHEDFPDAVDGEEVAEEVEVFPLECL